MKTSFAALALGLTALASTAQAACPTDLEAAAVAAAIVARQPVVAPAGEMSVEDGLCGRDKVLRFLAQTYGEAVGYKAGLTNPAVQKRLNYNAPLRGTLFKSMIVADGAEVPAAFADIVSLTAHQRAAFGRTDLDHFAGLSFVAAGENDDLVALGVGRAGVIGLLRRVRLGARRRGQG